MRRSGKRCGRDFQWPSWCGGPPRPSAQVGRIAGCRKCAMPASCRPGIRTPAAASMASSMAARAHDPQGGLPRFRDLRCILRSQRRVRPDRSGSVHADPRGWFTSLAVVSETCAWFLHRLDEEAARTFRLGLAEPPRLKLLAVDTALHAAGARMTRCLALKYADRVTGQLMLAGGGQLPLGLPRNLKRSRALTGAGS